MEAVVEREGASTKTLNHRVVITRRGGPEVLQVVEETRPEPQPGEVRLKVLAAGISNHDLMERSASFPGFPKVPFTPGVDVVGEVEALGEGVSNFEPGSRVAALLIGEGGYSEFVCVPADRALPVPEDVDSAQAVCLVANYMTAYAMLHRAAEVKPGERVLIHGAAGGVGTALLELGRLAELEMYGTASKHNHELVSRLGATPIDYRAEDFVRRIRQLTGDGVDAVFDPIGGAKQLWRSYRALRDGGRLVWFGVAATVRSGIWVIPASLLMRTVLSLLPDGKRAPMPPDSSKPIEWYRETLAKLLEYLDMGKVKPVVAERIPMLEAVRAHRQMESGRYAGKLVLVSG